MAKAYQCDRCGKLFAGNCVGYYADRENALEIGQNDYQLCSNCNSAFLSWLAEGAEEEQQEEPQDKPRTVVNCGVYDPWSKRCNGTKGREPCTCNGNMDKCDFYAEKRK